MRKYLITLICVISLMSLSVRAEEQVQEKKFSIGLGTYALILAYSDPAMGSDDEFSGLALNAAYAFNDNVAVKGAYYSLEHDDFSELEATGLDFSVVAGTGLATQGFKIYGGGGLFKETWEVSGFSGDEDFSGLQLVGGLGYNWDVIAIDLSVALRNTDDYVDLLASIGGTGDVTAVAGAFTVSARF